MPLELTYYSGNEAEQYSFYRIPKALFTDSRFKAVSTEAKVLYGLLLDRMGLSIKSGWMDEDGRVYIYFTLEDAMALLGCGHGKAVRLFAELDKATGIGLIDRKKQGQGRPTKIYVKNFTLPAENQTSQNRKSESPKPEVKTSQNRKSALPKTGSLDFPKLDAINTEINNTEFNDTDPINPTPTPAAQPPVEKSVMGLDSMDLYEEIIKENIEYDILLERNPYGKDLIDCIVTLMVETVCSSRPSITIAKEDISQQVVKSRLLKLDESHVEYVLDSLKTNTTKVRNVRSYLLTALYRAPTTIDAHYAALVNHDMYGGG